LLKIGVNSGCQSWILLTTTLARSNNAIPQLKVRSAIAFSLMAQIAINEATVEQSNSRSVFPSSWTGDITAPNANQPATTVPSAIIPKWCEAFLRIQMTGNEASIEILNATMAGPQVQSRVCGPIKTANAMATTRKTDEMRDMIKALEICEPSKDRSIRTLAEDDGGNGAKKNPEI
jgi:hypothetical protein